MKKITAIMIALGMAAMSLSGCSQSGTGSSASATPENPMVLTLAHGLSETHTVHIAMTEFAEQVEEKTGGRIQVSVCRHQEWQKTSFKMANSFSLKKILSITSFSKNKIHF